MLHAEINHWYQVVLCEVELQVSDSTFHRLMYKEVIEFFGILGTSSQYFWLITLNLGSGILYLHIFKMAQCVNL